MKITKYYLVYFIAYRTEVYYENNKRVEFDTKKEAQEKVRELQKEYKEKTGQVKFWAWKKEEIKI